MLLARCARSAATNGYVSNDLTVYSFTFSDKNAIIDIMSTVMKLSPKEAPVNVTDNQQGSNY